MKTSPIIELKGIVREDRRSDLRLLDNVDLRVEAGARLAIVGKTGSGKSLLLRVIALLDPFDSGSVLYEGLPIAGGDVPRYRTNIMLVPQRSALFEGTVESNLQIPFQLGQYQGRKYCRSPVVKVLEQLGRDESFLEKRIVNLSGGEAQVLAIVRALQLDPRVVILDEPTSALDAQTVAAVERLVLDWLALCEQRAFVWVTHDVQQAKRISNKCYRMERGTLASED